ncbi:MAG TPA: UDP-N-acetylmuramate dehydrogenase [Flavobacteriales bacterium]|nr:UDP-N-acetylmuramate dehydrogenase [Flavobacteriales bacterium]HIO66837.1 UDP-N-acetylmuramate dehydrogenase [Flavobacteriales bacterium]
MRVQENVSLKRLNSFGIDASARYFVEVADQEEVAAFVSEPHFADQPLLILGGGSNLLLRHNFEGVVLKVGFSGIELLLEDNDHYYLEVGAGENWHGLVMHCVANGYAGIENLSLIPGNVGAAPMQNIGAYGVELQDVFEKLEATEIRSGEYREFSIDECQFRYRDSVFKNELQGKYVITSVTLRLSKSAQLNTSYGAIEEELEAMNIGEVDINSISQAVINIRNSKLPDPDVLGNAGSFFKNPIISEEEFLQLRSEYSDVVSYPADTGVKIAAGWLIDQCGWKGKRIGNAGVHENHALVLANYGNATGDEIYKLSEEILNSVRTKFKITLEREVNVV